MACSSWSRRISGPLAEPRPVRSAGAGHPWVISHAALSIPCQGPSSAGVGPGRSRSSIRPCQRLRLRKCGCPRTFSRRRSRLFSRLGRQLSEDPGLGAVKAQWQRLGVSHANSLSESSPGTRPRPTQIPRGGGQVLVQKLGRVDTARCGHRVHRFPECSERSPDHAMVALHPDARPSPGLSHTTLDATKRPVRIDRFSRRWRRVPTGAGRPVVGVDHQ